MRNLDARLNALERTHHAEQLTPAAVRWLFDDRADQGAAWENEDWTVKAMAADWYAVAEDLQNETRTIN